MIFVLKVFDKAAKACHWFIYLSNFFSHAIKKVEVSVSFHIEFPVTALWYSAICIIKCIPVLMFRCKMGMLLIKFWRTYLLWRTCLWWYVKDGAITVLLTPLSMFTSSPSACNLMNIMTYRQVSNIRRTLVGNEIVDHTDVVGASPVGAAPTTSSFST